MALKIYQIDDRDDGYAIARGTLDDRPFRFEKRADGTWEFTAETGHDIRGNDYLGDVRSGLYAIVARIREANKISFISRA